MASPNGAGHSELVSTSFVNANDGYAVGDWTNSSGYDQTLFEHFDGNSWSIIPTSTSNGPFHTDLTGVVAISSNDVWIVGAYTTMARPAVNANAFAWHWDGSTLTGYTLQAFPGSLYSALFAVTATSSTDVWAVGAYWSGTAYLPLIYHWNGTSWSAVFPSAPNPTGNRLFAVSAWSPTDVWAVGRTIPPGSPAQSYAVHWDGATWSTIPTANSTVGTTPSRNVIYGVNALEANHAVGVGLGNYVNSTISPQPRQSQAWDLVTTGTSPITMRGTGMGTGDNILNAVSRSGSALQAVGYKSSTTTAPSQTLAIPATWDPLGHTLAWAAPGASASPGTLDNSLLSTTALSPYAFWATGSANSTGTYQTLTELYCGLRFSVSSPAVAYIGESLSLTATAQNPNLTTLTGYRGTVHFTSSDPNAVLPADYTFTPADAGTHVFSGVVLNTTGNVTITVADTVTSFVTATATLTVVCRGACPGPGGVPGVRDANQGPAGTAGIRDANQSGATTAGPRLPRLAAPVQGGNTPAGVGLATAMGPAPTAGGAAPVAVSTPLTAAPEVAASPAEAATPVSLSEPMLSLSARGEDMMAASQAATTKVENTPAYEPPLVLFPLAIVSLALLVVRRRKTRRLIGHARP